MTVYADSMNMLNVSGRLDVEIQRLKTYMESIETVVYSAGDSWQGHAEKAYLAKLLMLGREYVELEKLLSEFSGVLRDSAECYSELDSALAGRIALI